MTDLLFFGILIVLALGLLSFLWMIAKSWIEMILWFLFSVGKLIWNVAKFAGLIVTLPFRLIGYLFRLISPKKQKKEDKTEKSRHLS
ncbi:hypothetical protein ACFSO0_11595 [Brevibacillus sp. GCM10020057]|uniref:hypothetical protein n=1 Tax=Brevibacillus sp. GCM10020057 TaxID=3317327 RepID=UPI00364348F8